LPPKRPGFLCIVAMSLYLALIRSIYCVNVSHRPMMFPF